MVREKRCTHYFYKTAYLLQNRRFVLSPGFGRRRRWHPTPVLLAWKIPWMEEPGGGQSIGSLGVRHD